MGLASSGEHGGTGHVAGLAWLPGGQPVTQNFQSQHHVLREEGLILRSQTAGQETYSCLLLDVCGCGAALVNGPTRSRHSRHCESGNWIHFVECCACEGDQMSSHGGSAVEKAWSITLTMRRVRIAV